MNQYERTRVHMYTRSFIYPPKLLPSEVIEADVCVIDAQRVEQVEDGIGSPALPRSGRCLRGHYPRTCDKTTFWQ